MQRRGLRGIAPVLITAITMAFGLQMMRALFALLVYVLRERMDWTAPQIGLLALGLFLPAFLGGVLGRRLRRHGLFLLGGATGLLRVALQLWSGDPLLELILAAAGTVCFVLFLPVALGALAAPRQRAGAHFGAGLLLGVLVDATLHGAWRTYDLSWQSGLAPLLVILLLFLLQVALLSMARAPAADLPPVALPWLALGPFLFLQLLIFANLARLTTLTGWPQPAAFAWQIGSHLLALAAALWLPARLPARPARVALLAGVLLLGPLIVDRPASLPAALLFLAGQVALAVLLLLLMAGLSAQEAGRRRVGLSHGLAMLLLFVAIFLYYGRYDLGLSMPNTLLPGLAGAIVALAAVAAARRLPAAGPHFPRPGVLWLLGLLLFLLPPAAALAAERRPAPVAHPLPLRLMTYNLHNGFNPQGHFDLEALAQVIEAEQPDVVALQEVSRGWIINGSADMLQWLARRLQMTYVFAPTAGPLWGNAILSRLPIVADGAGPLPPQELLLRRGYVWIDLDLEGSSLRILNTHFHHVEADGHVRLQQAEALLDVWEGTPRTVVVGDLNAQPADPEMVMLRRAGLVDTVEEAGVAGGTYPSHDPFQHIDYIWLSPDLRAERVVIPAVTASDHRPVVATVDLR